MRFTPTHVSHKQVEAYPIAAAEFEADGSGKVAIQGPSGVNFLVAVPAGFASRGAPEVGDMLVRYAPTDAQPDGDFSHSPRAVFEAGYRPIAAGTAEPPYPVQQQHHAGDRDPRLAGRPHP